MEKENSKEEIKRREELLEKLANPKKDKEEKTIEEPKKQKEEKLTNNLTKEQMKKIEEITKKIINRD